MAIEAVMIENMLETSPSTSHAEFPEREHDHDRCVEAVMERVEQICQRRSLRLTDQRRRVMAIIASSHTAIGAYGIMDRIAADGRRPAPISVYRAIDFLLDAGLVHRIASRNAFVACSRPTDHHGPQFLICAGCDAIVEMASQDVDRAIHEGAQAVGFTIDQPLVEISGYCPVCRKAMADDHRS